MPMRVPVLALLVAALAVVACGGGATDGGPALGFGTYDVPAGPGDVPEGSSPGGDGDAFPSLTGGVLLTLESAGEAWRWWVTDPANAQALVELWTGARSFFTIGGVLRAGPGAAGHNTPWSWHVEPAPQGSDAFTDPQPPLTPSRAESELDQWVNRTTLFVPAGTTIRDLQDRR